MYYKRFNNPDHSSLRIIYHKFRYHLILQAFLNRLSRIGIELQLFYLVQEGAEKKVPVKINGNSSDFSFRYLERNDMACIGAYDCGCSEEGFALKLNNGEKCIGMLYKEKIVAFVWFDFNKCNYRPYTFDLKKNEAYLYFLYIVESFRGKNLASYLRYHSYDILNEMGKDVIYSIIQYFNTPAIKSLNKVNGKKLKLILYIRLCRKIDRSFIIKEYQ